MKKNWLRVFMAGTLSVLMLLALIACNDEKKTEAPSETGTAAPTFEEPDTDDTADIDPVEKGDKGLAYSNQTDATTFFSGLGSFTGTKLRIPGENENGLTVGGIQADALKGDVAAALTEIDIPSTVKKLPKGLFDECEKLETVRYFGSEEFWNIMLETDGVTIPENINVLFCKYYDLTVHYLYMDGSEERAKVKLSYINDSAFVINVPAKSGYRADVDFPNGIITEDMDVTVTYTKEIASGKCGDNLSWIYYEDNRLDIGGSGMMYDYIDTAAPWTPYLSEITGIVVGEGVKSIGAYAFANCSGVEHVLLPEGLDTVGAYAFRDWTDAQTIEFSGGVDILTKMDAVWNSNLNANICFRYGSYEQDNDLTNGAEPLVWTLVDQDNGSYLLTLLYAIELMPYHNVPTNVAWENCDLRAWLQNDFASVAFTEEELASQVTMQKGIGTSEDKLFIFTAAELASLFPEEALRIRPATAYANPVEIEVENEDGTTETVIGASEDGVYWWLRDSSVLGNGLLAQNVSPMGVTNNDGALVSTANRGVSVSVWVKP